MSANSEPLPNSVGFTVNLSDVEELQLDFGTAADPSLKVGAEDVGLYSIPSGATLGITAGGASRLTVSADEISAMVRHRINDVAEPSNPGAATYGYLYKKTGSSSLFWRTSGAGEVDLAAGGGGGGSVFQSDEFFIQDAADNTKQFAVDLSNLTAGVITAMLLPDVGVCIPAATYNDNLILTTVVNANDGDFNTGIGLSALSSVDTGSFNTAVGHSAGTGISTGNYNTVMGYETGYGISTGSYNTAIGPLAMQGNGVGVITGDENIAIGHRAMLGTLDADISGQSNIAVGNSALYRITTGNYNLGIGADALSALTIGENNVGVGHSTLSNTVGSYDNVAIGFEAGMSITTANNNVAVGSGALSKTNGIGEYNIAVGYRCLYNENTGDTATATENVCIGSFCLPGVSSASQNVAIGHAAMSSENAKEIVSSVAIGYFTMVNMDSVANYNVAVGANALETVNGFYNTAIGYQAGRNVLSDSNTVIGAHALGGGCDGYNTVIGYNAIGNSVDGSRDTTSANGNVVIGANSVSEGASFSGTNNVLVGNDILLMATNSSRNTVLGSGALNANITSNNVAVGFSALAASTVSNNTSVGYRALEFNETGTFLTAIGFDAMRNGISASNCVALGRNAGRDSDGLENIFVGNNAGFGLQSTSNIVLGHDSAREAIYDRNIYIGMGNCNNGEGFQNSIVIGHEAAYSTVSAAGDENILIGHSISASVDIAANYDRNIIIGVNACNLFTTGTNNIFIGTRVCNNAEEISSSTIVGSSAGGDSLTTFTNSELTLFGSGSGRNMTDSTDITAMGISSATNISNCSSLIAIGNTAMDNVSNATSSISIGANSCINKTGITETVVIGNFSGRGSGTITESSVIIGENSGNDFNMETSVLIGYNIETTGDLINAIVIGANMTIDSSNSCHIANIRGVTTDDADAIPVLIDSSGQLGTVSSSIVYKENIETMQGAERLYSLRPVSFNYKTDKTKKKTYGLIAEEVLEHIPEIVVRDKTGAIETIQYHLLVPMMLDLLIKQKAEIDALRGL